MKNFEMIREAIKNECRAYVESVRTHMTAGKYADSVLERNSTPTRWNQYTAGTIDREAAVECAMKRVERATAKREAVKNAKLDAALNAIDIVEIDIHVHWAKSRTWGNNPNCTIYAIDKNGATHTATGRASGCGYDKRSAAVANALNQIEGVLKALYTAKEAAIENGINPDPVTNDSNARFIAYGAGYGALPYFEGGVGINSTLETLKKCGFDVKINNEIDPKNDWYNLERVTA